MLNLKPADFVLIAIALWSVLYALLRRSAKLDDIPSVGYSGIFTSYLSAIRFMKEGNKFLEEGYRKHKNGVFKVPQFDKWLVIVTGDKLTANLRDAPEHVLSLKAAMNDILQTDYTLGRQMKNDAYIASLSRFVMNKNLSAILPDILDEMVHALKEELDSRLDIKSWTAIPVTDVFTRIICRTYNRAFVGLPTCRNKEYCDVNMEFTFNVVVGGAIINMFPTFLKPYVGKIFAMVSGHLRRILKHLRPIIEERKRLIAEHGKDYPGKPNDLLSLFIDTAPATEQTTESLALWILNINFAALHTSSMTFIHALYQLAVTPDCVPSLRAEIEEKLGLHPSVWTKEKLDDCWKLDSFFRESQRVNVLSGISMTRKTLCSFTFSDGTTIPAGVHVGGAAIPTQMDDEIYDNPKVFDPFRFAKLREEATRTNGESGHNEAEKVKLRVTDASLSYFPFGGGRHTCLGRFLASNELKSIMALILLNYDIKTEVEGERPGDLWFGAACLPNSKAKILFKRR